MKIAGGDFSAESSPARRRGQYRLANARADFTFDNRAVFEAGRSHLPDRITAHPGEILREEFPKPLGLSVNGLAALRVPATRIGAIIKGERSVTPDTALRLARLSATARSSG